MDAVRDQRVCRVIRRGLVDHQRDQQEHLDARG